MRGAPLRRGRFESGWASTRASRSSPTRATWVWMSIGRRASRRRGTEGRFCCRRPRTSSWVHTPMCATLERTGSKDLAAPEHLYQLGSDDFPLLRSLNLTNLPVQPSPLVGRKQELKVVLELLHRSRLLTLTGPGGGGKTRLAVQAAAEVTDEFSDGVWFVSLAALRDPDLVVPTIASTVDGGSELAEGLGDKRPLLVLDNCEQLLPGIAMKVA